MGKTMNNATKYSNYLAEQLDKRIDFSKYIDQFDSQRRILYSEYLSEKLDRRIDHSIYLNPDYTPIKYVECKKDESDDYETQNFENWEE